MSRGTTNPAECKILDPRSFADTISPNVSTILCLNSHNSQSVSKHQPKRKLGRRGGGGTSDFSAPVLGSSTKTTDNLSNTNPTGSCTPSSSHPPCAPNPPSQTLSPNNTAIPAIVPGSCFVCKHMTTKFTLRISHSARCCAGVSHARATVVRREKAVWMVG
jgi:hypothetical protein